MKHVVITYLWLIPIILIFIAFKSNKNSFPEKIEWNTHFNAKPDNQSPYVALTATIWQYSYVTKIFDNHLKIDFKFVAGIDSEKSWVKRKRIKNREISRELLNHEQGHVYINYLLLKQGELTMRNQKYTIYNYKKLIQLSAVKVSKKYGDMQSKYDIETKHGSNLIAQNKWDNFLIEELSKYND